MTDITKTLADELGIDINKVNSTIKLIDEGNTIPFIARYRKEVTGGLDDATLRDLYTRLEYLRGLQSRREEITRLIDEQDKLTEDIISKIQKAQTMTELDDIYRPFRPKRRTRATIAKEKGLKPLANMLITTDIDDIKSIASEFLNPDKDIKTIDDALQGAMDIIAELISDNADYRKVIRDFTYKKGSILTSADEEEVSVYDMYYEYSEPISQIAPHRILAINRGESEKVLSVKIDIDEESIVNLLISKIDREYKKCTKEYVHMAAQDAYKRLIAPSIEREIRNDLTEIGETQAIEVFGENLKNLLLQPPLRDRVVMGIDPGYRTGNKIAIVDRTGRVLDTGVVYMTLPNHNLDRSKRELIHFIDKHAVDVIAIGNGTGSKETEIVIAELISKLDKDLSYMVISEAGASVYSASRLASEEFPDFDVALRSAVSIARRLQDPLAELVKIDPKSIGVGQYQHDVNQKKLEETLKGVVESCVNSVGIDLNTASPSLLSYIAGITQRVAKNIVSHRESIGEFRSRKELLKVKGLGPKTFKQSAGFLRVVNSENILDNTGVHPESYDATNGLLESLGYTLKEVKTNKLTDLGTRISDIGIDILSNKLSIGVPTLTDIIEELKKPGRDPRDELPKPMLRTDIMGLEDLKQDMILRGTVRNVVDFGAFIDIGVNQDGLVHISQLSNSFVKHPMDVVKVGDVINVKVLDVDKDRGRISLSMKDIE
ncbi:MAG: RNA-binding transcriptional accessory protein [Clostridiales bacterium]|nr:RNA-binding transcriptional accessory protein [Clostridiales bacterium]